jgi:hypothetical protein
MSMYISICILAHGERRPERKMLQRRASRTLRSTASAPGISPHGDGLGVVLDVLEVLHRAGELPAVDGLSRLAGVLVGDAEVGTAGARGLGRLDVGGGVADLWERAVLVGGRAAGMCEPRSCANHGIAAASTILLD